MQRVLKSQKVMYHTSGDVALIKKDVTTNYYVHLIDKTVDIVIVFMFD
jgi:hypothetical protein